MVPVLDDNKQLFGVFNREVLYQVLLANISLDTKIEGYVNEFQGSSVYDMKYDDVKEYLVDYKVCSFIILEDKKQLLGLIKMKDIISHARKTNWTKSQLEKAIFLNFLGAFKLNEEKNIIIMDDGILYLLDKDYSKVNKPLLHSSLPIFTEGNTVFQNDLLLKEIKQTKNIKRWQNMLDAIIEQLYDGIAIVNEHGKIIFLNHKIPYLFNVENEKGLGKPIKEVIPILNLEKVLESGVADLSRVVEFNGVLCIIQNIPVFEDGNIIGAISRIMYNGINEAREKMRHYDLSNKMAEILGLIRQYESLNKQKDKNEEEKKSNKSLISFEKIITEDLGMKKTLRYALKAAKGRSTILIRGESGTGKELFAQAIHNASDRKDYPFVSVNCAAIPEHLLESEFFGYEQGAFTGAEKGGKIGKFDLANGGTLFLDEIGDMAPPLQAKLLRVFQDRGFYRVGGIKQIHVDVRIIAATHRNLELMIKNGKFREDLYYRLNVVTIDIPALRERRKDIMVLTKRFMKELNKFLGTSIIGMDPAVEDIFTYYSWPGNIRELKNVIESAMTFTDKRIIEVEDLPKHIQNARHDVLEMSSENSEEINGFFTGKRNVILEDARQLTEQQMIMRALQQTQGNKTKAAKVLGISRSVLYEKLAKYQLKSW
ncbi:sigma 54-interacting transcriptional regulator [Bacillus sp. OK048]|uniref:sigma 54-interacting transcriptional regulator n=1 Tax=Bacillus sp. OK048 TaxID=1882761 RepID=UPI001587AD03|nr:sigma 54-interacting transcriptional regulator [Bacillus sp. OK048]